MLLFYKRYRQFGFMEWLSVVMLPAIIAMLFTMESNPKMELNLLGLYALWCFLDLIEIKGLAKIDASHFRIFPMPAHQLLLQLVFQELISLKSLATVILSALLIYYQPYNFILYIPLISIMLMMQIIITIVLYHIAYRFTKFAILIRYLFVLPFFLTMAQIYLYRIKGEEFVGASYLIILVIISSILFYFKNTLQQIVSNKPFVASEYLKTVKKNKFHW